jgi:glycosyltransferase involved in cell wall biosynthesis
MDASWKLTAAGGLDLKEIGLKYLGNDQFTYLGFLEPSELFKQIHKSELVSVLSECFDVYPTIALEAFMHNSIPITSLSTGIVQLVEKSGCGIILDDAKEQLTLEELKKYIYRHPKFPIKEIELCTSGDRYLKLLKSAT